jgi:RNase H-like protein
LNSLGIITIEKNKELFIILSDCKIAINGILNKWKIPDHDLEIKDAQSILKSLECIPEIYWIKGHSGIPGNELADQAAKKAAVLSTNQMEHPNFSKVPLLTKLLVSNQVLVIWNKEWKNPNFNNQHEHCKSIIYSNQESSSMVYHIFPELEMWESRLLARLISGHVKLNEYLYSIKIRNDPFCEYCIKNGKKKQESMNHFFFNCKKYLHIRKEMVKEIDDVLVDQTLQYQLDLRLLFTGYPVRNISTRLKIIKIGLIILYFQNKKTIIILFCHFFCY